MVPLFTSLGLKMAHTHSKLYGTKIFNFSHEKFLVSTMIAAPPPLLLVGLGQDKNLSPYNSNILSTSCWNLLFPFDVSFCHVSETKHDEILRSFISCTKFRNFGKIDRVLVAANVGSSELFATLLFVFTVCRTDILASCCLSYGSNHGGGAPGRTGVGTRTARTGAE